MRNTTSIWFVRLALAASLLGVLPAAAQTINEDLKIVSSDAGVAQTFGSDVAISGTTSIIGAAFDSSKGFRAGAAYLFDTITGQQQAKLTAPDPDSADWFGFSVAIYGTTAIVGSPNDDDFGSDSGSVYVFDTTNGQALFKLTASDAAPGDFFGNSVAIFGSTAIVGAVGDDDTGVDSGSAYVFDLTTGHQLFKLTASDAASDDLFGNAVAISGTTAIVGARQDDHAGFFTGSVYVFDTASGQQLFKLTASDAASGDFFGSALAISGTTAIIGADGNDDDGTVSGSAYLFDITTGQELFKLTASDAIEEGQFGTAVDIDGAIAIVGAISSGSTGSLVGSGYIFDTTTGQQRFQFVASDGAERDDFGSAVAISDTVAIVGARLDDDAGLDAGEAYIFYRQPEITGQPQSVIVSPGETAVFTVGVTNPAAREFRWRRDGVLLTNGGNISGARSSTLQIIAQPTDAAIYDCVINNPVPVVSDGAILSVRSDPNACPADLNGDGDVNFFDVSAFLAAYSAGCP